MFAEFILDPSDADPVLPWETHLVDGHAFPHHILRVWYIHLNIAMATEQLHVMYHALQQLHSGRQIHLDTQQVADSFFHIYIANMHVHACLFTCIQVDVYRRERSAYSCGEIFL